MSVGQWDTNQHTRLQRNIFNISNNLLQNNYTKLTNLRQAYSYITVRLRKDTLLDVFRHVTKSGD